MKTVDRATIKAVRKALYEPRRLKRLLEEINQIDILMNLNPDIPLAPGDVKMTAGSGPLWFYPDNGQLNTSVIEAASRCERVAAILLEMRNALSPVAFPAADKKHLQAGLEAEAAVWRVRGRVWRAQGAPDVDAVVAEVKALRRVSIRELKAADVYLVTVDR
jgi:hypothetical protein